MVIIKAIYDRSSKYTKLRNNHKISYGWCVLWNVLYEYWFDMVRSNVRCLPWVANELCISNSLCSPNFHGQISWHSYGRSMQDSKQPPMLPTKIIPNFALSTMSNLQKFLIFPNFYQFPWFFLIMPKGEPAWCSTSLYKSQRQNVLTHFNSPAISGNRPKHILTQIVEEDNWLCDHI